MNYVRSWSALALVIAALPFACSSKADAQPRGASAGGQSAGNAALGGSTAAGESDAGALPPAGGTRTTDDAGSAGSSPLISGGNGFGGASAGGMNGSSAGGMNGGSSVGGTSYGAGGANASGFVHPGILVSRGMLDFVKARLQTGAEPWHTALLNATSSNFGSLSYTAHPRAIVECGSSSNPDNGCSDEKNDASAAYTHALLWYYGGDSAHADKAIEILNAWSAVLQQHTNSNAPLQSAWAAEVFPRAAEILRASYPSWKAQDIAQFSSMLKNAYLPYISAGSSANGNWEASMIEAILNIAIFNDDRTTFNQGVAMWRKRTPAYLYLSSDGATPVQPPTGNTSNLKSFWYSPKSYVDGLSQETCRDTPGNGSTQGFGHAQYGIAALLNAAETARIQGVDLLSSEQKRFSAALELHAKYLNGADTSALCATALNPVRADPTWEIGYNAYVAVLGGSLPATKTLLQTIRPTGADHHMIWESLTHGEIGAVGLP